MPKIKLTDQPQEDAYARIIAAQSFSRAAGAPLVHGNSIRLLKDAGENYPAWLEAIHSAKKNVYFENYIICEDDIGHQFADALIEKAKEGVRVRLLYDWLGCLTQTSRSFWRRLGKGGVEVRCFNPLRFDSPLAWLSRLHRKSVCVDDRVAFVSGLCVGQMWDGYPDRDIPPWRDTGVELRGQVVADVVQSFARAWGEAGPQIPADELPTRGSIPIAGKIDVRVLGNIASTAGLYRLEQLIAVLAQKTLWLTDAYFVGTTSYTQALRGAAMDGVDVRLLVPGSSGDLRFLRPISRTGYRPLLEAGVRVFEWNGSMLHAKTAVADGRWARVGSSNLNMASWLGNWELDVAVENPEFAQEMEQMYLQDLENATEIVLSEKNRVRPIAQPRASPLLHRKGTSNRPGSASRLTAGALRVGNTVGAAITRRLVLGAAEAKIMFFGGATLLCLTIIALFQPFLVIIPFSLIAGWIGVSLLIQAYQLHKRGQLDLTPQAASNQADRPMEKAVELSESSRKSRKPPRTRHSDSPEKKSKLQDVPDKARRKQSKEMSGIIDEQP